MQEVNQNTLKGSALKEALEVPFTENVTAGQPLKQEKGQKPADEQEEFEEGSYYDDEDDQEHAGDDNQEYDSSRLESSTKKAKKAQPQSEKENDPSRGDQRGNQKK